MSFGAEDLATLLAEFGVNVTLGATTTKGLVERWDEPAAPSEGPAEFVGRRLSVTVQTGALPGIGTGSSITVEGEGTVKVADRREIHEGAYTQLACASVT